MRVTNSGSRENDFHSWVSKCCLPGEIPETSIWPYRSYPADFSVPRMNHGRSEMEFWFWHHFCNEVRSSEV
jgi:hypothetical protein